MEHTKIPQWKLVGMSIAVALLISAVVVPMFKLGLSPLPKPVGLAFAAWLLGHPVPLPVGLLFHTIYVSFWAYVYFAFLAKPSTLLRASLFAFALYIIALFVFFPLIGWGIAGLAATPKAPFAALIPHALFAVFLWLFGMSGWLRAPAKEIIN